MRIVGGSLSGRVLRAPAGAATRPTSEKGREAVFNILGRTIDGAAVLDLFAGSGAVGIEALSRGAAHATFVDSGKRAIDVLTANLAELDLAGRATVVHGDALRVRDGGPWRFVYVDPPYASDLAVRAVAALPADKLTADATIVIEHDRRHVPPDALGSLLRTDQRRYGDTSVSFFTRGPT